jgi:membrane protease YdiL (CAAX protease family)
MNPLLNFLVSTMLLAIPAGLFLRLLRDVVRRDAPLFPKPSETPRQPIFATLAIVVWLTVTLLNKLVAESPSPAVASLRSIQVQCGVQVFIAALFTALLTDGGRRPLRDCGIFRERLDRQILLGILAFFAAVGPTGILLILSQWWRTVETQHALLQTLQRDFSIEIAVWIVMSAAIAAPLTEELLFRVTLQGWLSERFSGPAAIGVTAVVFALIHGWRDALPLLPLSLILGYVFHQTRSYWACVTTHALFNGTFLVLALMTGNDSA